MFRTTLAILFQICSFPFLLLLIILMIVAFHSVDTIPLGAKSIQINEYPNSQLKEWEKYEFINQDSSSAVASHNSPVPSSIEDPHMFSNYVLSYEKPQKDKSHFKSWISKKLNKLISPKEIKEEEQETEEITIAPRSANPNEVFLPIDFNLLIPSQSNNKGKSLINSSELSMDDSKIVDEEEDEHVFEENVPPEEFLEQAKTNDFEDFDTNSLDFVQQLIRRNKYEALEATSTTNVPPIATTTPITSSSSVNGRKENRTTTTTIDYRNISFDLPERRFFMSYPIRRLLMAYFAPRILRFQMAMLLNSVIGEVSRKIFDPILGRTFGLGGGGSSSSSSVQSAPPSTLSSASSQPSPLSVSQLAQSLSSLSSLSSALGNGILPSASGKSSDSHSATLQSSPAQATNLHSLISSNSPASSISSAISSAVSNHMPSGTLQLSPQNIQALLSSLNDSDQIKQLISMATSSGAIASSQSNAQYQSNVDYQDEPSETETSGADLMPT